MSVTVRGAGSFGGNGAIAPGPTLPTGTQPGDLLILVGFVTVGATMSVTGWTQYPLSPVDDGNARKLYVFYKIASVGESAPSISVSASQWGAQILGIQVGTYDPFNPFDFANDVSGVHTPPASGSSTVNGITTSIANQTVLMLFSLDRDANGGIITGYTRSETVTEHFDNSTTSGVGGGVAAASFVKVTPGATGTTAIAHSTADPHWIVVGMNDEVPVVVESQLPVEVVAVGTPAGRLSQQPVEVLAAGTSAARLTQEAVEVVARGTPQARMSQVVVEVIRRVSHENVQIDLID